MRTTRTLRHGTTGAVLALLLAAWPASLAAKDAAKDAPKKDAKAPKVLDAAPAKPEAGMTMEGGAEGTVFGTLTVTGEDRISIEFDRPELSIDLDARTAPGLEWGDPLAVLERSGVDLAGPLLEASASIPSEGIADEWAAVFREGAVARFRPALEDVESWRLTIVDSRSDTVAVFDGHGEPPDEIAWDGIRRDGRPAAPGLVYSYVLEAADKAGNRRTFPGQGFEIPPYRTGDRDNTAHLFAASSLPAGWVNRPVGAPPAILLEVATRINRAPANTPVEIRVGGRSVAEAKTLADAVRGALDEKLLGDPARVRIVTDVRPDAPKGGTVAVLAGDAIGKKS